MTYLLEKAVKLYKQIDYLEDRIDDLKRQLEDTIIKLDDKELEDYIRRTEPNTSN